MQPIHVLIVEDDPIQQELLTASLSACDSVHIVGVVDNGEALIRVAISHPQLSALFLDIDLGDGMNGFESYSTLKFRGIHIPTVLVTGRKPDASRTFDLDIVDVLEKPYTKFRLKQTVEKLRNHIRFQQFHKDGGLFVPIANDTIIQIPPSEILFFESINRAVFVHTETGSFETKISLKTYETYLQDHHYYATHRSYLVNMKKVSSIEQCKITFDGENRHALTTEDNEQEVLRYWKDIKKLYS